MGTRAPGEGKENRNTHLGASLSSFSPHMPRMEEEKGLERGVRAEDKESDTMVGSTGLALSLISSVPKLCTWNN